MALIHKKKEVIQNTKKRNLPVDSFKSDNTYELTQKEYEFLFEIIKTTSFKGESVDLLYNIVYKLQEQYISKYKR
jgi:hypothetical protein